MNIKLLIKDISWDVLECLLGLEPLSDDAPLEDHIKRQYQEIPEKVKELCPELPNEVTLDITLEDNDLEEDGKSIYAGVLASIVNDKLFNEYGYNASSMGDFIVLEGELEIYCD